MIMLIPTKEKNEDEWVCSNCGQKLELWLTKNMLPCINCNKPYPYSITLLDRFMEEEQCEQEIQKRKSLTC